MEKRLNMHPQKPHATSQPPSSCTCFDALPCCTLDAGVVSRCEVVHHDFAPFLLLSAFLLAGARLSLRDGLQREQDAIPELYLKAVQAQSCILVGLRSQTTGSTVCVRRTPRQSNTLHCIGVCGISSDGSS